MSAPAANAFSLPVSTIAPTPASASRARSAVPSSAMRPGLSAFSCFGRLSVTIATRPFCSTLMNSYVMAVDDLRVETVERGEESGVHLPRGNRFAAVALRARRARIAEQRHLVAEIGGLAHRRVDAHVRHHPGDDQVLDSGILQVLFQGGTAEAIREILLDHELAGLRLDRGMDLRALRARQEKSRSRAHREMAHVNHWLVLLAEARDDDGGFLAGCRGTFQLHRAAGEVVVLDVDDEQRGVGHGAVILLGNRAQDVHRFENRGLRAELTE